MDWKHNQWVGVGAAALLVVAIAGVFMWNSGGSGIPGQNKEYKITFQCKSTGETFQIGDKDLNSSAETFERYMGDYGTATECRICSNKDALRVYYCPQCKQWYAYERTQGQSDFIRCPKEHSVPAENQ